MFLGAWIEPLLVLVRIPGAAAFGICSRGAVNPLLSASFMSVTAVLVAVADIIPMFRVVMRAFEPLVAVAVPLHDPFIWNTIGSS